MMNKSSPQRKDVSLSDSDSQNIVFWGVRGTLPTPGSSTIKYGGNSSSVEIQIGAGKSTSTSIVLDAGSGICAYGDYALSMGQREFHILLSHMHYDHIIGLTKFAPLFRTDCKINFYGQAKCGKSLKEIITAFFSVPFFPISFDMLPSKENILFHELNNKEELNIGGVKVALHSLNHPQGACAFRVWNPTMTTSVVYATDHEHGTETDSKLVNFAKDATLFLYDSTYSDQDYMSHKGWGHSTPLMGALIAKQANVAAYGIFHHAPEASDLDLEKYILPEAKKHFTRSFLSKENFFVSLSELITSSSNRPIEDLIRARVKFPIRQTG